MVLKSYGQSPIINDGLLEITKINGKLIKVIVVTNQVCSKLRIRAISNEYEEVINTQVMNEKNIYYPYNNIENVTPEYPRTDYFYILDKLYVYITGIQKGEYIQRLEFIVDE